MRLESKIDISTDLAPSVVSEIVALCTDGWINGFEIDGSILKYRLEPNCSDRNLQIVLETQPYDIESASHELIRLYLGLHAQGISQRATGELFDHNELKAAIDWCNKEAPVKVIANSPLNTNSHLTLQDLEEIHSLITQAKVPIAELIEEAAFSKVFPYVDLYCGDFGSLRHRSGHEIFMRWIDNRLPSKHKLDAPNPSDEAYKKYSSWREGKTYRRTRVCKIDNIGSYSKSAANRRKYAYLFGGLPEKDKRRVFSWISEVINAINYYHDSRGQQPLPEQFEIIVDDKILTATHDLIFRIKSP